MDTSIKKAIYELGFGNSSELLTAFLRVKKTKKAVTSGDSDEQIFQTMREVTESTLGYFPGDSIMFTKLYHQMESWDIFELLSTLQDYSSITEYKQQTPAVLMEWLDRKLHQSDYHSVLVTEAEHCLAGICDIASNHPQKVFSVTTRQTYLYQLLLLAYENYKNVQVVHADIYDIDFPEGKYDFIFSVPSFGGKSTASDEFFICRELDLIATENLLNHLSDSGVLSIVLPAKISFGGDRTAKLRRFIEKNYCIAEINELPHGLFRPYTRIKTYLFEFTVGETESVIISSYDGKYKPLVGIYDMKCIKQGIISKAELQELGDWRVELLLADKDESLEQYEKSSTPKIRLGDMAEVFRGKAVAQKDPNGNISIVNISNISEAGIDYKNLDCFTEEERKIKRYELQSGDVLVTSRGTTIRAASFEEQDKTCIASANLMVIRPGKKLSGKYLKVFFDSPVGITLLKSFQRGTGLININHSDIMELGIPIPPMKKQEEIVARYEEEQEIYHNTIKKAQDRWDEVKCDLYREVY